MDCVFLRCLETKDEAATSTTTTPTPKSTASGTAHDKHVNSSTTVTTTTRPTNAAHSSSSNSAASSSGAYGSGPSPNTAWKPSPQHFHHPPYQYFEPNHPTSEHISPDKYIVPVGGWDSTHELYRHHSDA